MKKIVALISSALSVAMLAAPAFAARTDVPVIQLKSLYATPSPTAGSLQYTPQAADISNGNSFKSTGKEILQVTNSGGSAYTLTIHSVADSYGRTSDVTAYSLAAGDVIVVPVPATGYKQADGTIWVDASNAAVKYSVFRPL